MNNLLFSLAMAALSQFTGLGGGAPGGLGIGGMAPGGFGGGLPVPGYGVPGYGTQGYGGRPPAIANPGPDLKLSTLAVVQCLHDDGRISGEQARGLIAQQGARRGWPQGWEAAIAPRQVGQVIGSAGGCQRLLAQVGRSGSRIAQAPLVGRGQPSSEAEQFGLAPYR
jgi:hypothetical protein